MNNHSRVFSYLNLENINKEKLASKASKENFAFLSTKYEKILKSEHLACQKVGGGGRTNPLVAPPFLKVRQHVPLLPPFPSPLSHQHSNVYFFVFLRIRSGFAWSICNRCGMQAGNAYPSGHLAPSPFLGLTCKLQLLRSVFPELAVIFLYFSPWIPLGTFSILLLSVSEAFRIVHESDLLTFLRWYLEIKSEFVIHQF